MMKSRFTEEQIIGFLKHAEDGMPIKELCRNGGFSDATFYKWRASSAASRSRRHIRDGRAHIYSSHKMPNPQVP